MLAALAVPAEAQSPTRFAASKVLLAGIHQEIGHLLTLYCGCPYARRGRSGGDVDREAFGLAARKNETRSDRIEWEHVVPASWFGSHGTCWQSGHELCGTKKNGKPVKGRTCCLKHTPDNDFRHGRLVGTLEVDLADRAVSQQSRLSRPQWRLGRLNELKLADDKEDARCLPSAGRDHPG